MTDPVLKELSIKEKINKGHNKLVYDSYKKVWGHTFARLAQMIKRGERNRVKIWRALHLGDFPVGIRKNFGILKLGKFYKVPFSQFWKWFAWSRNVIHKELTPEIDTAVEFGSGWGRNIFHLLDRKVPTTIKYYSGELLPQGRHVSRVLAKLYPEYNLTTFPFDYMTPDCSAIKKGKNIFVYTMWSIEQVTNIPMSFLTQVLELGDNVTCVHMEPVGWQMRKEVGQTNRIGQHVPPKNHYNRNLWKLLSQLRNEGKIVIDIVETEYFNLKKPKSAGTYIRWHKIVKESTQD